MNIYDVPCPMCASPIVSTARMMDDSKAPTQCANGHTFTRLEAFDKAKLKAAAKDFYRDLESDLKAGRLKINASTRLNADKWSQPVSDSVKDEDRPPEGLFLKSASAIARGLKKLHPDLKSAMSALNFYINRAGKNVSNKDNLEKAKDELRKLYGEK